MACVAYGIGYCLRTIRYVLLHITARERDALTAFASAVRLRALPADRAEVRRIWNKSNWTCRESKWNASWRPLMLEAVEPVDTTAGKAAAAVDVPGPPHGDR